MEIEDVGGYGGFDYPRQEANVDVVNDHYYSITNNLINSLIVTMFHQFQLSNQTMPVGHRP
jgi:hypothetical protein